MTTPSPYGGYAQGSVNQMTAPTPPQSHGGYPMPAGSDGPSGWGDRFGADGNVQQSHTGISPENRAPGGGGTPTDLAADDNPPYNPYGGAGSYGFGGGGGGGGAAITPGLDNASYQTILNMIQNSRPQQGTYNPLDLPDYNAPDFYKWDSSPYDTMKQGITDQISSGRASGMADFDVAGEQLAQYTNPYGQVRTTNPGIRDSMQRMFSSQGVGMGALDETDAQGQMMDAGFGYTQNLMAGAADQRQAGNLRALAGDRRHFNETLSGEERSMQLGVAIAQQKAKAQYDKDLFAYGKEEADKRFEINMQEAIANHTGENAMNAANLAAGNAWQQGIISPIMELIMAGRNSEGVQGIENLGDMTALFPQNL